MARLRSPIKIALITIGLIAGVVAIANRPRPRIERSAPERGAPAQQPDVPTVAAAADLNAALPELARLFTQRTGRSVTLVFGSSGTFTQQIQNGAPFELFLSADERYVQRLVADRRTEGEGALYAIGRIALFLPNGSVVRTDSTLADFTAAVRSGEISTLAIANPAHAPYGHAAMQALTHIGVRETLQPKLVLGENAAQATQFAMSGSAQGGIIPLSLAMTPEVRAAGSFVLIDARYHEPLRQRMVLLAGAGQTAIEFQRFLQTTEAREIFARHGFLLPAQ